MRDRSLMPRRIKPELVEIGDEIEVVFRKDRGIEQSLKGIVGKEMVHGLTHTFLTSEGATIMSYETGKHEPVRIVLHSRAISNGEALFSDLMESVRERIA